MRVSELLGFRIVGEGGEEVGRVFDIRVRRRAGSSRDRADQVWRVEGIAFGRRGLRERLGLPAARTRSPDLSDEVIAWDRVIEIDPETETVVVRAQGERD